MGFRFVRLPSTKFISKKKGSTLENIQINTSRIIITGAAGLVGQNLIPRLKRSFRGQIVAIDKHANNLRILENLHPDVTIVRADLSRIGAWSEYFSAQSFVVLNQAQIGGLRYEEFETNNIEATRNILKAAVTGGAPYIVHISSSVVNSKAVDWYTETKKAQEALVDSCPIPHSVLRPTLMFGWFDRKHLGWLRRFMERSPVFPIPGNGRFLRQPLYVGDLCSIIVSCLDRKTVGTYDITGLEKIDYIDLIRKIRNIVSTRTVMMPIPYALFELLLRTYALFDRNPPFTVSQLEALVVPDVFDVIDWPGIFGVESTSLDDALRETFLNPIYSGVVLDF